MTILLKKFVSVFYDFTHLIETVFGNYIFLLTITALACVIKLYLAIYASSHQAQRGKKYVRTLLIATLVGFIIVDLAWILELIQLLYNQQFLAVRLFIRASWATNPLLYLVYALFVESLVTKDHLFKKRHIPLAAICAVFFSFFAYSVINFHGVSIEALLSAQKISNLLIFFLFMSPSIIFALYKLRSDVIPKLLKKQIKICIYFFILPQVIINFLQFSPLLVAQGHFANNFAFVELSTLLLTFGLAYCARRIIGLRFLNIAKHVQATTQIPFVDQIKQALDQLSYALTSHDIEYATDTFFTQMLSVEPGSTKLYVRTIEQENISIKTRPTAVHIEQMLRTASPEFTQFMQTNRVFIYDELEFSNFYKPTEQQVAALAFLERINADIFIPIYKDKSIIATIAIDRHARTKDVFYSDVERDKMLIFTQHLSNIIYLIQHRSFNQLVENERMLENTVQQKAQQLDHSKESLQTIAHSEKPQEIGVLFYRSPRFLLGNWNAQKLLGFDLIAHPQHAIAQQLQQLAERTIELKTTHHLFFMNDEQNKIVAYSSMSLSQNHIIITLSYADTCDIVKEHFTKIPNLHEWDYLLYLETTRSGQLINQLIPASTKELLMFKVELLRASFNNQPLLLDMADDDLSPTVEIIHQIGLRNKLHVLHLKEPTKPQEMAAQLFGFGTPLRKNKDRKKPLFEQLSATDTLFIQNIDLLDLVNQEHLVELIKYGYYRQDNEHHKQSSSVRIILSSSQPLEPLVKSGKFNIDLYNELQELSLRMSWFESLSKSELHELVLEMAQQIAGKSLVISDADLTHVTTPQTTSFQEFKQRVASLSKQPTHAKKTTIDTDTIKKNKQPNVTMSAVARKRQQPLKNQKS